MGKKKSRRIDRIVDKMYEDDLMERRHSLDDEAKDLYNPQKDEPRLEQDYETPASPAKDTPDTKISKNHPQTDTNIDKTEEYDEGISGASGMNDSLEGDAKPKRL